MLGNRLCIHGDLVLQSPGCEEAAWAEVGVLGRRRRRRKDAPVLQQLEDGLGNFPRGTQDVCD